MASSGCTVRPSNARVAPSTKARISRPNSWSAAGFSPGSGRARLSRRAPQIARRHVRRIEGHVDLVAAVLEEGGVDLELPQLMGAGGGGRQGEEGGEEEGAEDGSWAQAVSFSGWWYGTGECTDDRGGETRDPRDDRDFRDSRGFIRCPCCLCCPLGPWFLSPRSASPAAPDPGSARRARGRSARRCRGGSLPAASGRGRRSRPRPR